MSNAQRIAQNLGVTRLALLLLLSVFCLNILNAQATGSPSTFTWENYRGTSQWSVTVTEDDTGCGAVQPATDVIPITIRHDFHGGASTSDLPHSPWSGTFSGNMLTIPARSVSDPPGTTSIPTVTISFSSDCRTFSGYYQWDYSGPDQSCSGTTRFSAARTDAQSCPVPTPPPPPPPPAVTPEQVADARQSLDTTIAADGQVKEWSDQISKYALNHPNDPLDPTFDEYDQHKLADARAAQQQANAESEAKYAALLKNDPNNYWLNMDMAELKKAEGDKAGYAQYVSQAVGIGNANVYESTREKVVAQALADTGLPAVPTVQTSPALNRLATDAWNNAGVLDIPVNSNQDRKTLYDKVSGYVSDKVMGWFRTAGSPYQ